MAVLWVPSPGRIHWYALRAAPLWQRFASVLKDRTFVAYALSGTLIQGGLYALHHRLLIVVHGRPRLSPRAFSILFGVNASGLITGLPIEQLAAAPLQLPTRSRGIVARRRPSRRGCWPAWA
jgi:hypothetical protein